MAHFKKKKELKIYFPTFARHHLSSKLKKFTLVKSTLGEISNKKSLAKGPTLDVKKILYDLAVQNSVI